MIDLLIEEASRGGPEAAAKVLVAHEAAVLASAKLANRKLVMEAEAHVAENPGEAFSFDAGGHATLQVGDRVYAAGRFGAPSLGELKKTVAAAKGNGRVRLFVLDGASPATDIGGLLAFAPKDTLFQVASQFNCLEAPDACIVPVNDYLRDPTQGPRAAIACFPGALLRHYAAPRPDGTRFVQKEDGEQLNLLSAVCGPGLAEVQNGYLMDQNIKNPEQFITQLETRFDDLKVGLHVGIEVVLGYAWDGAVPGAPNVRVSQAFTSTLAAGGYSAGHFDRARFELVCGKLQHAAQLGTLLGAAASGARRVVLTLIGGGVFGNPVPLIWRAIKSAVDEVAALGANLDVVVNGRNLGQHVPHKTLVAETEARGGIVMVAARF